jgi:exodeoxyribonuclease VII large subunit
MDAIFPKNKSSFSLCELNSVIRESISSALPDNYWVTAEIADTKLNQKGHCYLDLVEREDSRIIAQVKANIWAYEYRRISAKFQNTTKESLKRGMKVLLFVGVSFHEVYGLSLNIRDIDPAYTMGEMAMKKREVIERLIKEGVIGLNKSLCLPLVAQRIAVISSPTAAGYGDFFDHLDNNIYGYKFEHVLFPAIMQGDSAEESIISALNKVRKKKAHFDLLVIIRGGGSVIDLNCFDCYNLALHVAKFPFPVITGIGHEKDDTVADMAAHTKMKTPTAVAEFLISGLRCFEEKVFDLKNRIEKTAERYLKDESHSIKGYSQRLHFLSGRFAASLRSRLEVLERSLGIHVKQSMRNAGERLEGLDNLVRILDPENVLRRGYSLTHHNGKAIRDASLLLEGDVVETRLSSGSFRSSIIERGRRAEENEQEQAVDLFSGIDRA